MKINKFLTFAGISLALLISCDDATDIVQDGELNPGAIYETVEDMQISLNGVYGLYNSQNEIRFATPFTDEAARGSNNGGQQRGLYVNIIDPTSGSAVSLWSSNYNVANEATRLIEGAELVERTMENGEEYDQILGQAYALRGLAHFNLIKYFAVDLLNSGSAGVPNLDFIPVPAGSYPRDTTGDNLTLIQSDLGQASSLLGGTNFSQLFIGADVVSAIRARLALYTEDYTTAESLADQLIANYSLATTQQYIDLHNDVYTDDVEVIWAYDFTATTAQGNSIGNLFNNVSSGIDGAPILEMSRNVFNKLEAGDVRRTQFVDASSRIDPDYETSADPLNTDVLVVNKYPGSFGTLLINDIKLFRVSEMYFIKAEARIDAGDLAGAANAIAAVNSARFGTTVAPENYSTATQAWAAVLEARQLELYAEGHRYLDLKRIAGKAGVTALERDLVDCSLFNVGAGSCNLSTGDFKFQTLPIPIVEINGNTGINAADQNPGY
jgi:hypothetical protein